MVKQTNDYAVKVVMNRRAAGTLKATSHIKQWVDVDVLEMKRLISIVINTGLTVRKNIKDYCSTLDCDSIPWYSKIVSCNGL